MKFTYGNNKSNMQNTIKNKQQLYKRFCMRFKNSHNPGERTFLKQEITRIVSELKKMAAQWKKCGYGSNVWVVRGYSAKTLTAKGTWSSSKSRRTSPNARRKSSKTRSSRKSRVSRRTRSTKARRSASRRTKRHSYSSMAGSFFSPFRGYSVSR